MTTGSLVCNFLAGAKLARKYASVITHSLVRKVLAGVHFVHTEPRQGLSSESSGTGPGLQETQ
ncbi:MAG: hypothetical protein IKI31_05545, partial [Treponema sp.]|nr:hypothetical protein [Treponema sp.]